VTTSKIINFIFAFFSAFLLMFAIPQIQNNIVSTSKLKQEKIDNSFNIDSNLALVASVGQQRALAAFIWTFTLLAGDIEHHSDSSKLSWMYYKFDNISKLDPYFYKNYLDGGLYLSVIKDDVLGAEKIYNKGLEIYPNDFWLNFYDGFNKYYELNKPDEAIKRFEKIIFHPITRKNFSYISSLTARMKSQQGSVEESYKLIEALYLREDKENLKLRYFNMLNSLRIELDLNCLNLQTSAILCNRVDLSGNRYQYRSGQWISSIKWKKFNVYQRKQKKGEP